MTALSLLVVLAATFQTTSTHCAVVPVQIDKLTDQKLVACGPQYSENILWNLDRADGTVDGTARRLTTGRGSVVYVVDTGVEASHDEFQRIGGTNVIGGLDPLAEISGYRCGNDSPTHPCYSGGGGDTDIVATHGTAVASIVAGRNTGVAPDASIVSVRVLGFYSTHPLLEIFNRALDDIVKHAFDPATPPFKTAIVSMSATPGATGLELDYGDFEQKMKLMIGGVDRDFHPDPNGKHFLFVVFAGNNNSQFGGGAGQCTSVSTNGVSTYPALAGPSIDGLITVGGMDRGNYLWEGTCRGPAVEILAPADHILCASYTGHDHYRGTFTQSAGVAFDYTSGTSYATPYVSGIAARMLEADPSLTPVELEQRIKASPSYIDQSSSSAAGGHVAVLIESPPPVPPKRRAVTH
jgi:subtilisin family serine protease